MAKKPKAANAQQKLARRVAGIGPKAKLPAKGSLERRAYDSAMRAQQRLAAAGKVSPKTGRPLQSRPSRQVVQLRETIAAEKRLARKKEITLRNVSVLTVVNGGTTPSTRPRVRQLGDITMTRSQYRYLKKLDQDQDDELTAQLFANVSPRIEDLANAKGVDTLEISDVRFSSID